MDEYLEAPCVTMNADPAKFWKENQKNFPSLVAKEVLSVPASSAPVERLSSIAGKVFSPEHDAD